MNSEWLAILNKVKSGELSAEEAARLIDALEAAQKVDDPLKTNASVEAPVDDLPREDTGRDAEEAVAEEAVAEEAAAEDAATVYPSSESDVPFNRDDIDSEIGWWKQAWMIPFWVGTGIFVLGTLFFGWAYSGQHSFWLVCSVLPMAIGLFALFLGWWSREARWLHVRVQDSNRNRVAISMPIPLRFAGWILRVVGPYIPQLKEQNLTQLPMILESLNDAEGPMTVEVNGDNGERVRVYIL